MDVKYGRQLSEKNKENKRLYWKEVKDERKKKRTVNNEGKEMKNTDGKTLKAKTAVKER